MDQGGLSVINGKQGNPCRIPCDYGWGGSQWNYGRQYQGTSSVFQFWDEYDGNSPRGAAYTNSTSSAPWQRPRLIQNLVTLIIIITSYLILEKFCCRMGRWSGR